MRVDSYILYPFSYRDTQSTISEYDFIVNVGMVISIAIHKICIIYDLVNKLLITKISPAKILIFSML